MNHLSVTIVTLGCAKNSVDSDIMQDILRSKEFHIVEDLKDAQVIVVNTCGFIDSAKEESINTILDIAEYKTTGKLQYLIVTGCLAQRYKDELMKEIPEIDGIVGTGDFDNIHKIISECHQGSRPVYVGHPAISYDQFTNFHENRKAGPSAYVKIAEGCNNFCTFCIIPKLRGAYRSRTIESITREVQALAKNGTKEINLVAQDSSCYGIDIYGEPKITGLLYALQEVEGIEWIRLLYAYPGNFNDDLIHAVASLSKVCKYVELPLQHSEDRILKLMRRPGLQTNIRELIAKIRTQIPNVAIRTSLIVGFPGETIEDFELLKQFVQEIKFDRLGVFTYSLEEDTAAANLTNHIEQDVKERRAHEIMEIQRGITETRNSNFVGKILPILIEKLHEDGTTYIGRTPFDAPEIDGEVFVTGKEIEIGKIIPVTITHVIDYDLAGEVSNVKPS
ncbi:ribosomal protein S12 methylthiotransferase RimO [Desulfuribacillus stibiiarsenatis]|uniref:Ribosomal protein uS12 methylthiotransferase RimO n=1 Tax=Desulfuribacillus stibiiarsenatis TaxID=1390249 RepID=A0A1E5L6Y3_9FIRM|nr:30S ribosomal protein S12 methylthiotransferase RimO [Desulfuribacillus stibiiarsenatis]OEH85886.1 ribosomal protein S12 methylthiotransferase RimO [Desulfuribacillus stibiiarsenatis]